MVVSGFDQRGVAALQPAAISMSKRAAPSPSRRPITVPSRHYRREVSAMTRGGLCLLLLAMLSGGCASATPDLGAGLSPEQKAECDRRARQATRSSADAPLTSSPYTGASQWFYAPDRAAFEQSMRDSQYKRCLEETPRPK